MIDCRWRKARAMHGCTVAECSGFLARIRNDPNIIFADEPTGNIDSKTGDAIMDLLLGLARARKKTLLVVTHDNNLAQRGDRMLRILTGCWLFDLVKPRAHCSIASAQAGAAIDHSQSGKPMRWGQRENCR
jgi:ABC-type Mn2+/Zn2+ transport system ATPase subunit